MVSHREKMQARYQEVPCILQDYRDYLQLTEDEDLKDKIKAVIKLIEGAIASNIPEFVERLTNVRSPERPTIIEEVRQHVVIGTMVNVALEWTRNELQIQGWVCCGYLGTTAPAGDQGAE